jgi:hypothetical protein
MNIFDFDCRIEMLMGDDPEHMESKIITKPTVVRIPQTPGIADQVPRDEKAPAFPGGVLIRHMGDDYAGA